MVRELLSYLGWDILEHRFATDAVYLVFESDEICELLQEQRHWLNSLYRVGRGYSKIQYEPRSV